MAFLIDEDEPEPKPLPSREEALAEVADWKRRVDDLYRDVIGWLPRDEGYEVDLSLVFPVREPMQQILGLPAYEVALLQVRRNGKRVMVFRPDARWVMNTRGRVRMGVGDRNWYTLLAKEMPSGALEWRFWSSENWERGGDPWTKEEMLSLLSVRP